ncbi:hypothetical protein [Catellatospora paridis]|uniref:hypothetical protein n=1 Tax=Catellatospora paridis TaxID=1617086 RepID=UPI0012D3AB94|nr:hypothetical protein [Catellatospora paridis]
MDLITRRHGQGGVLESQPARGELLAIAALRGFSTCDDGFWPCSQTQAECSFVASDLLHILSSAAYCY